MRNINVRRIAAFIAVVIITMANATSAMAKPQVDDKEIIGVWIMKSMMWEGENKNLVNASYNQVKIYRANGEYACAQIFREKNGKYSIVPHEYGTYTMKDGMYSEMGREPIKYDWVDKTTSRGRWYSRIDVWKKVTDMPEELTLHILNKCKVAQSAPEEMQKLMKKHIFNMGEK